MIDSYDEYIEEKNYYGLKYLIHLIGPSFSIIAHIAVFFLLLFLVVGNEKEIEEEDLTAFIEEPIEAIQPIETIPTETDSIDDPIVSAATSPMVTHAPETTETPSDVEPFESPEVMSLVDGLSFKADKIDMGIGNQILDTSVFGSSVKLAGDLSGYLYDIKRDRYGKKRKWNYKRDVSAVLQKKFRASSLNKFHKIDQKKYLSHLFIPKQSAANAPRAFQVEKSMEPKGFFVHYTGKILPENLGKFRFVGHGDDLLMVLIDGKVVLEANWGLKLTDWHAKENINKHMSFTGQHLVYGDWIDFSSKKAKRIDLIYGESPGGLMSAVLLVEEQNALYQKAKNGRDILPVFALHNLSTQEQERLRNYKDWDFPAQYPDFGWRKNKKITDPNENIAEGLVFIDL